MTPAINLLKKLKIPHKLYPYECEAHDDFGKHAATQLGLPEAQVFKTLIAHHDKQAVVAIVPSSGLCSLKQLAKATGLKKVEMMKPAEAEKLTGYKVGGISPLAQKKLLPTVLDDSAMQFDEILVSGGKRGLSVGVAPADMLRLMQWIAAPSGNRSVSGPATAQARSASLVYGSMPSARRPWSFRSARVKRPCQSAS